MPSNWTFKCPLTVVQNMTHVCLLLFPLLGFTFPRLVKSISPFGLCKNTTVSEADHPLKTYNPSMDTLYIHALLHLSLDNLSASVRSIFSYLLSPGSPPEDRSFDLLLVPHPLFSFSHYPYSQIGSAQNFYIFANVKLCYS